jgi:hypothetical protein
MAAFLGFDEVLEFVERSGRFLEPEPDFLQRVLIPLAAENGHEKILLRYKQNYLADVSVVSSLIRGGCLHLLTKTL